jgi:hypothetical protein
MHRRTYTDLQLREAVSSSKTYVEILKKLGIIPAGGNYESLKKIMKRLDIDTSHLLGQAVSKGQKIGPKRELKDYLSNQYPIKSHNLRLRLLREKVFDHKCSSCSLTTWLGRPIPLELDHINGKHSDNSLSNLRLLCPNCHALTPTYRGRNKTK